MGNHTRFLCRLRLFAFNQLDLLNDHKRIAERDNLAAVQGEKHSFDFIFLLSFNESG